MTETVSSRRCAILGAHRTVKTFAIFRVYGIASHATSWINFRNSSELLGLRRGFRLCLGCGLVSGGRLCLGAGLRLGCWFGFRASAVWSGSGSRCSCLRLTPEPLTSDCWRDRVTVGYLPSNSTASCSDPESEPISTHHSLSPSILVGHVSPTHGPAVLFQ